MLKKFGINSVCAKKTGPNVKEGIDNKPRTFARTITCSCGKRFEKSCPSEAACDVSSFSCPYCGTRVQ
jgi:hypothetical protein